MNICDNKHPQIVYGIWDCPLCKALETIETIEEDYNALSEDYDKLDDDFTALLESKQRLEKAVREANMPELLV